MTKNIIIIVLVVVLIGLVGALAFYMGKSEKPGTTPVVNEISTNEALVKAFAEKTNRDQKYITVSIGKEVPGFVQGGVRMADVEVNPGAAFFAAKVNGKWEIVWSGHGTYECSILTKYNFPVDFKKDCYNPHIDSPKPQPAVNQNDLNVAGIKQAFATKYNKNLNVITVNIIQQSGNYFRGNVRFSDVEINSGAMFLARKVGNTYEIVVDGHGTYTCNEVLPLGFPQNMISDCSR